MIGKIAPDITGLPFAVYCSFSAAAGSLLAYNRNLVSPPSTSVMLNCPNQRCKGTKNDSIKEEKDKET